jgi:serine phosphatase RsbU (regulator of sigma subunit)/anti-sigma regulatory factor (Ser/Thr protein kinase)
VTGPVGGGAQQPASHAAVVSEVFDQLPEMAAALAGPDFRVAAVNDAFRRFLGRNELLGISLMTALPDIAGQQIWELLDRVYSTGVPETGKEWRVQIDRGPDEPLEAYVDFTVLPWRSATGEIGGLLATGHDVTASVRQRIEAERHPDDAERRYIAAREVTARLQAALLPTTLPVLPRARVSARYLVAGQDEAAGGDWFDAIPLDTGEVALVVGDVVGHGVAAAAAMAQLRAVLSELLLAEPDFNTVLARADAFAARTPALRAATLVLAVLDADSGALRYATCGHPPPLVLSLDGTARYLAVTGGGPLGTGSQPVLSTGELAPGEVVLLYSDGLIERPGRSMRQSLAELATVAADAAANRTMPAGAPQSAAERVCNLTIELLTRSGYADDVTTLAAERLLSVVPDVSQRVPSEVGSLTVLRRALQGWLSALEPLPDDRDAVHMAVVEVVTNAIEHAYPAGQPGPIDFTLTLQPDGQMECIVADYGTWRPPDATEADRGNGLMVARHLVDQMHISHPALTAGRPAGAPTTVVTLRHRLRRPAVLAVDASVGGGTALVQQPLDVTSETVGDRARAFVRGAVDITTADQLLRRLLSACRGGTLALTVDLTGVTQLASAGVSALYQLADQLTLRGGP